MGIKFRIGLLSLLLFGAIASVCVTYTSIMRSAPDFIPDELYARFLGSGEEAEFYLRPCGGYIAVYPGIRDKVPLSVTGIELSALRSADRALIEKGLPVSDERNLLFLLEDLGS